MWRLKGIGSSLGAPGSASRQQGCYCLTIWALLNISSRRDILRLSLKRFFRSFYLMISTQGPLEEFVLLSPIYSGGQGAYLLISLNPRRISLMPSSLLPLFPVSRLKLDGIGISPDCNPVWVCAFPVSRLKLDGIGISPDCNPVNRATTRQLFNWALEPAEDDILDNLFEVGYMDAEVWGNLNPVEEMVREEILADNAI